ncbi:MAG: hypothetical protein ACJAVR_001896 [Paracoccaceae bacterium]|jgi:hypothetical protein
MRFSLRSRASAQKKAPREKNNEKRWHSLKTQKKLECSKAAQ